LYYLALQGEARAVTTPDSPSAEPLPAAPAFAGKARDLEALRAAVVDAAAVGAGLWLSYLFVLFYLAIATGGVTHRDLLFENPVRLPFLNVDLPLRSFFALGPAIFLIAHAYVLLHFVLLAAKVGAFHAELQAQIADEDARVRLRRQLPSNIFVQVLAGPREVRTGIVGFLLRLIAQISLAAGPIALLMLFLLQFLPYHHEGIAWWQRIAVLLDLALLWALWPSIARGETTALGWRDLRRAPVAASAVASVASVLLVFTIATFPGEWLHANPLSAPFIPWGKDAQQSVRWLTPHELLIAGNIDLVARKPTSLWSNRLVLPNIDLSERAKFDAGAAVTEALSLRDRHLEGAVLIGARLRNVDFTAAKLEEAALDEADLRGAKFLCARSEAKVGGGSHGADSLGVRCAQLQRASLKNANLTAAFVQGAQLQHAQLYGAQLQGTAVELADLQGASLVQAELQHASFAHKDLNGASFDGAHLQGVSFIGAGLQGASFDGAQLQGASLADAALQGASFSAAQLQGASLDRAELHGAVIEFAQLQGASLQGAQLQGANLGMAQLQAADLDGTQLHGAFLSGAGLDGASLVSVSVWRTTPPPPSRMRVVALEIGPKSRCSGATCEWSTESYTAMRRGLEEHIPEGGLRDYALTRVAILDPATASPEGEAQIAEAWAGLAEASPSRDDYGNRLLGLLHQTGCERDGAPYVIRGLLRTIARRFPSDSQHPAALAAAFLDEASCPGAKGLSDEDKAALRAMAGRP
jgi:uncharacterized protein YjbI with pentapeptide repeats